MMMEVTRLVTVRSKRRGKLMVTSLGGNMLLQYCTIWINSSVMRHGPARTELVSRLRGQFVELIFHVTDHSNCLEIVENEWRVRKFSLHLTMKISDLSRSRSQAVELIQMRCKGQGQATRALTAWNRHITLNWPHSNDLVLTKDFYLILQVYK